MFTLKVVLGIALQTAIFGGLLFLPARTLHWWRGWVFIGVTFVGGLISMLVVFLGNDGLLAERFRSPLQKGQPLADKIVLSLFLAILFGLLIFIPLDVFRWHLLPEPGPVASAAGLGLVAAGWTIITLALAQNPFAAPVVKRQDERGQVVVDTGVYGVVRHPMYAGAALFLIGMPLWLESYAGALLACLAVATLALRIVFEERFLRRELKGYDAYTERVRYRLIPFGW